MNGWKEEGTHNKRMIKEGEKIRCYENLSIR